MAIAMHHSRAPKSSTIAVLLGIANHDGDGGAWPTVATLAHYARITPRSVQRELESLIRLGEIDRDIQGGGTVEIAHYDRPNLYHFVLTCPPHCDRTRAHKLICKGCGKPLPKSSQTVYFHAACAPVDPVTPVSPGDTSVARGATGASSKPSIETTTYVNKEPYVGNRVREQESDASGAPFPAVATAPASRRPEGPTSSEYERLRRSPSGEAFDLARSVQQMTTPSAAVCPNAKGRRPHTPEPSNPRYCRDCGERVEDQLINAQTGEVA